jgi:hypothetical protein
MTIGIASWRGAGVSFTDGMCAGCATRFRRLANLPPRRAAASVPSRLRLVRSMAGVLVVTAVLLAHRSLDDVRAPVMTAPPPETVFVPAPVGETPAPRPPLPRAPRRLAATKSPSRPSSRPAAPAPAADAPSEPMAVAGSDLPVDTDIIRRVSTESEAVRRVAVFPRNRRLAGSTFAALPHAGLTEQTP